MNGTLVDTHFVVTVYRGSDSDNTEGISWWTTNPAEAADYASRFPSPVLMARTLYIPVIDGMLVSPSPYLIGGRHAAFQMEHDEYYLFGLDIAVSADEPVDFCISMTENLLKGLSIEPK